MLNVNNISMYIFQYYSLQFPARYYPKVYIGTKNTLSSNWQQDHQNGGNITLSQWPESLYRHYIAHQLYS